MTISLNKRAMSGLVFLLGILATSYSQQSFAGEPIVPGTGKLIEKVGDDFEDPEWKYNGNFPKVFNNEEDTLAANSPYGRSANGRWFEGPKRGQPDYIRRVDTPADGIPGSKGALVLRSLQTGTAKRPTNKQQQDDFIASVIEQVGRVSVARCPNVVTRVYLPPTDQWEDRTGCQFGFRLSLQGEGKPGSYGRRGQVIEKGDDGVFWPGMFIDFYSKDGKGATGKEHDYGAIRIRADQRGHEPKSVPITVTGWWTLGMSVSPDGEVHYYAKPGVEDLTPADYIISYYPYGKHAYQFQTFFFNVCNSDDDQTWSTEFIIDDPRMYLAR
jgi:hypothetical protein